MHSGCVRQSERKTISTQCTNCLDWYPTQITFLEKNSVIAAKFVDSFLKILNTEQENDKIIFPSYRVCSVAHISLYINRNCCQTLSSKGCWMYNLLFSFMKLGEWKQVQSLYPKGQTFPSFNFTSSITESIVLISSGTDTRLRGGEDKRIVLHTTTHLPISIPLN